MSDSLKKENNISSNDNTLINQTDQQNHTPENQSNPETKKTENPLVEIIRFTVIALLIVLPVRFFIAQPFIVSGDSMKDTFHNSEYIIVDQLSYHFEKPERGEVIIFRYPLNTSIFFIKRIIGIPGDTIIIDDDKIKITNKNNSEGIMLQEPYILKMKKPTNVTKTLGPEEYFVLGDNRDHSSDSRVWGIVKEDKIVGRAFLRLYPFSKVDIFPGAYDINIENDISTSF